MSSWMIRWIGILNMVSTLIMVGLIWFVQVVHYPLTSYVADDQYPEYQVKHMVRTTGVVAVPMLVEALTAGLLVYVSPAFGSVALWRAGFLLVLVNLFSTYFLQKPAHETLRNGYDSGTHQFLVSTNWIRTAAWSIRGLLWVVLLADLVP